MAKIIREETKSVIDVSTGEVRSEERNQVIQFPKEPAYVKLYLDGITRIHDMPSGTSNVLYELLKKMDYEHRINLNAAVKKRICEIVDYKKQSLDNYLSMLCKNHIFKRVDRGVFEPNPELFGRGDWKDIYKKRQAWLKVTFSENGSEVTSSMSAGDSHLQQDLLP